MYQTLATNAYNTIPTMRPQNVSLYPVGQNDQLQIASMKLGSHRRNRHSRSSVRTPQFFLQAS